ncbi:hypothetical protein ACWDBW_09965 [Streptomyces sp. NPDC001107]
MHDRDGQPRAVPVVDDDPAIRRSLERGLRLSGFRVRTADRRGSIARLRQRVDNAKAAGHNEIATYLQDRLTFRKSLVRADAGVTASQQAPATPSGYSEMQKKVAAAESAVARADQDAAQDTER